MSIAADILPITETRAPADQVELIAAMRAAFAAGTAVYPLGGVTSLDFGLPARTEGIGLSLSGLARVVDYPAADMTITVEAGITMASLAARLAEHGQCLPIDVPQPEQATLGGVVATSFDGPRRYGAGTIRDHVIGISAVDGRGMPYKGGGRVVKNVAGYDFCKLLTGSLGTLGVITQVTLRLKPLPVRSAIVVCCVRDLDAAEKLLAGLAHSETSPVAIELLGGPAWSDDPALAELSSGESSPRLWLVVGLEGTGEEVAWMIDRLGDELRGAGADRYVAVLDDDAVSLWRRLQEFPAAGRSPLVLKANVKPSATTRLLQVLGELDADCSFQAHAGNGIVVAKFSEFPAAGLSRALVGTLVPAASAAGGNIVVLSNPGGAEMTRQSVWGGIGAPFELMSEVKRQFDPKNLLNPGRFVYA